MTQVTLVYPYYDNADMLREHIAEWSEYRLTDKEALQIVIVDDGSPNKTAYDVLHHVDIGMHLKLFRVIPNIPWNQDGARNLGMENVNTKWALMTDMDHMLDREQVSRMLQFASHEAIKHPKSYWLPTRRKTNHAPYHAHANSFLLEVADFWGMGGYDEDFAGVYGSDGNFRRCAQRAGGLHERFTQAFSLTLYGSEDVLDANTKDWGRKESEFYRVHFPKLEEKRRGKPYKATNPIRFAWERQI